MLAPQKHSVEVRSQHRMPVFQTAALGIVQRRHPFETGDTRIIYNNIQPAVRVQNRIYKTNPIGFASHVKSPVTSPAANLTRNPLAALIRNIAQKNHRALTHESPRDSLADPRSPGNQGNLPRQPRHRENGPFCRVWSPDNRGAIHAQPQYKAPAPTP